MKPTILRTHLFNLLFHLGFYSDPEEVDRQLQLYLQPAEKKKAKKQEDIEPAEPIVEKVHWWRIDEEDLPDLTEDEFETVAQRFNDIRVHLPEIDEMLTGYLSAGWKMERVSKVDLSILRLAIYEIRFDDAIPVKVAINEAVELAKRFGGDDSYKFVNGVLHKAVPETE